MSGLIRRVELFNELATVQTLGEAYAVIQGLPEVDAVEVVRCKDCKHNPLKTWFGCPLAHLKFDGDRWCWKGEREEGDDEQTQKVE